MKRTFHGSCHCGAVKFEVDIDLANGTGKCNCTYCWKNRNWSIGGLKPAEFRLVSGEDRLGDYARTTDRFETHHRFCTTCGTQTHGHGHLAELGGDYVAVRVAVLDDLAIDDLVSAPVRVADGLHDNWWNAPADARHL